MKNRISSILFLLICSYFVVPSNAYAEIHLKKEDSYLINQEQALNGLNKQKQPSLNYEKGKFKKYKYRTPEAYSQIDNLLSSFGLQGFMPSIEKVNKFKENPFSLMDISKLLPQSKNKKNTTVPSHQKNSMAQAFDKIQKLMPTDEESNIDIAQILEKIKVLMEDSKLQQS